MTTMPCRILLFANLAEDIGARSIIITVEAPATVRAALETAAAEYSVIAAMRDHLAVTIGDSYVSLDRIIQEGDELALIPPVSGG